jgi:hypothetical protein
VNGKRESTGARERKDREQVNGEAAELAELAGLAALEEQPTGRSARRVVQTYGCLGGCGSWNYFALKRGNYRQTWRKILR